MSKYDEDLEGVPKKTFRLDEAGGYDVDKEEREAKIRRDLEMANKKLVSLDMPDKFKLATEFYTQVIYHCMFVYIAFLGGNGYLP